MIQEYQLRLLPQQAANEQAIMQYIAREKGLKFYDGNPQDAFPDELDRYRSMMLDEGWDFGQDDEELFEFAMHERQYRDYKSGVAKERFQKELESFGCKVPSLDNEICAAIAMALDEHMNDSAHDMESYVITIKR